jgi:hypothetical protein
VVGCLDGLPVGCVDGCPVGCLVGCELIRWLRLYGLDYYISIIHIAINCDCDIGDSNSGNRQ